MRGDAILSGHNKSCGCQNYLTSVKDLTNQICGVWKAIRQVPSPEYDHTTGAWWLCRCVKCGEEKIIKGKHFTEDHVSKCSQEKVLSKGEQKIKDLLISNNCSYKEQLRLSLHEQNRHLFIDFAILTKQNEISYFIEFQGEQHYKPIEYFGGEKHFLRQQENDHLKEQYCLKNNIPLIQIPYTKLNTLCIEDLKPETTTFLYKGGDN